MKEIKIKDDFIKLCQLLKLAGLVSSGVEAKIVINEGEVLYNGELPQEERALYLDLVKPLFGDGESDFKPLEMYTPEIVVRFSKLPSDDTFEVMPESNVDYFPITCSIWF